MTYKALAALRDSGAIEVIEVGRNRHRAVYRLHLDPMASVHLKDTHKRAPQVHEKGAPEVQNRVHLSDTPRSTEEDGESRPGDKSPPAVVSPAPDAPVDNPEDEFDPANPEHVERRNRQLIEKHGLVRALRVIEGGKTA